MSVALASPARIAAFVPELGDVLIHLLAPPACAQDVCPQCDGTGLHQDRHCPLCAGMGTGNSPQGLNTVALDLISDVFQHSIRLIDAHPQASQRVMGVLRRFSGRVARDLASGPALLQLLTDLDAVYAALAYATVKGAHHADC